MPERRKSLCYIDDNESQLSLFEHTFKDEYDVHLFDDSEHAVEKITEVNPDLIVLDVNMPGKDGYEVCRSIRRNSKLSKVPVVYVSCMKELPDRLAGYEAGGDAYVTKPYELKELKSVIRAHLVRHNWYQEIAVNSEMTTQLVGEMIRNNGELGQIIKFARMVANIRDERSLIHHIFQTLGEFGLEVTIMVRLLSGEVVVRSDHKPFTLMEKELLDLAHGTARINCHGNKYIFTGRNIILLVKNMPVQDEDLLGRLKDHLAILLESAEAAVEIINGEKERKLIIESKRAEAFGTLATEFQSLLSLAEQINLGASKSFETLAAKMETAFVYLELTEQQEREIMGHIEHTRQEVDELFHLSDQLKNTMDTISDSIGMAISDK